jgi:DNA-binding CsgD family transcriptional regulator
MAIADLLGLDAVNRRADAWLDPIRSNAYASPTSMNHLTRNDYAGALALMGRLEECSRDAGSFAREAVVAVSEYVASELTTLSVCDLATGHREVVGLPGVRLAPADIECFDRHFFEHPLVRYHGMERGRVTRRISDSLNRGEFRRSALYADYYRRVGLEHAAAVPLWMDGRTLVSLVLNRRGLDFSERDRERLELLRPHLAFLYRQLCARRDAALDDGAPPPALHPARAAAMPASLTPREREVLRWLAHGKLDAEIAALLSLSPRTVHKHLEHIYVKLGVETRTAAVMRALAMRPPTQP